MKLEDKVVINSTKKLKRVILKRIADKNPPVMPVDLDFRKIGDSIQMSWQVVERYYLEDNLSTDKLFGELSSVEAELERITLKIEDSFKGLTLERMPNRKERRSQLKGTSNRKSNTKIPERKKKKIATSHAKRHLEFRKSVTPEKVSNKPLGYFRAKQKLSLIDWLEVIQNNLKSAKKREDATWRAAVSTNEYFLLYRENRYKELLSLQLNKNKEDSEKAVENWYDTVIKEDSFMIEK